MPFTVEQFLNVMKNYNEAIWPFQIVLNLLAVTAIAFAVKKSMFASGAVSGILGFLWLWMGIAYHLVFFTGINRAAYVFGSLFVLQGLLFLYTGVFQSKLSFQWKPDRYRITGGLFFLYALIVYPILSHIMGHVYPKMPTFGLPCPTTILTFGLLLWASERVAKYILVIPFLWAVIGFSAAVNLKIREDLGLFIAGVVGIVMTIIKDRKRMGDTEQ
jgi:hypothetical protein